MMVVHIHRRPRSCAFSIENLFRTVAHELRLQGITVIDYSVGAWPHVLKDIHALWSLRADVYHITGDVHYWVFFLPHRKTVLTIHDIGIYLFGLDGWKRLVYKWFWLAGPMYLAKRLTAVSTKTRDNLVDHLRLTGQRIRVIENCHHSMYRYLPKKFDAACPRILQVGTKPYKNVPRLIYALRDIPCRLVLVGELDEAIQTALADTGVAYENPINLTQEALLQQYMDADLVAFVSIGEGFGVPIIEAQAMGRPLITANIPPMSDAAGEGACLADPLDVDSIRAGLIKLIEDEAYRDTLVEAGLRNVVRYSPRVVAAEYLNLYGEVAAI